jgi:acetolactate synthase-1/3 small subunit
VVAREMALVKVHAPSQSRAEITALATVFAAKVVDVGVTTMVIEMTGAPSKVDNFLEVVRPFGIKELMRTGRIALMRGERTVKPPADVARETEKQPARAPDRSKPA